MNDIISRIDFAKLQMNFLRQNTNNINISLTIVLAITIIELKNKNDKIRKNVQQENGYGIQTRNMAKQADTKKA